MEKVNKQNLPKWWCKMVIYNGKKVQNHLKQRQWRIQIKLLVNYINASIPSLKLTYPLNIDPWKKRLSLETIIFRGYVRECRFFGGGQKLTSSTCHPRCDTVRLLPFVTLKNHSNGGHVFNP